MIFLVRCDSDSPRLAGVQVKAVRKTPMIVPNGAGKTDRFCVGESDAVTALRNDGWDVVELRDGWYADDDGGGVAVFGHGRYWEIRTAPLTVKEAVGPGGVPNASEAEGGEQVNVRKAIFGV